MPHTGLAFRIDPATAPHGRAERTRLIRDLFDLDVAPLDRFGHDPSAVSFGWWHGDDLVANLGLARQPLHLDGVPSVAVVVQWVAVREAWRGRGLFRDLMARAIAHADARDERMTLGTETPELYTRFGFRPIVEAAFAGPLAPAGRPTNHRRLSLADDGDVALIRAVFARRTPVSRLCAVCEHPALFFLKALAEPEIVLEWLPDLDAVVAIEPGPEEELILLDVVAPVIPPLAAIAAALGGRARRARVRVTPDRLDWTPTEIVPMDEGLMVRGPWLSPDRPAALSPMRL